MPVPESRRYGGHISILKSWWFFFSKISPLLYGGFQISTAVLTKTCLSFKPTLFGFIPHHGGWSNRRTSGEMCRITHCGRDNMAAIFQTTFTNTFSSTKMLEFRLKFHWSLFLRVQLTIFQHWFRYWLVADQATSHYLNQCWLDNRRIYASLGLNDINWEK